MRDLNFAKMKGIEEGGRITSNFKYISLKKILQQGLLDSDLIKALCFLSQNQNAYV